MKSVTLTINNAKVRVPAGSTILDAARSAEIDIPTLCYLNGYQRQTSCMVCVVHELGSDTLLPACSAPVAAGMRIETEGEKVAAARKNALDLLLSEHVGDCRAPCIRACPAHMDIPRMIRAIKGGRYEDALGIVKRDIALPAVLGRICPAPCEQGCNRRLHDAAVSVCLLKRFVADRDPAKDTPSRKKPSGRRVAIIGTGPTGISAAYYILLNGHACDLYDKNDRPGGALRYAVPEGRLPGAVLDAEIGFILDLGATLKMERSLGRDMALDGLREEYDAVVLAPGVIQPQEYKGMKLDVSLRGIVVNRRTFETSLPGVFSGGNAIAEGRLAVRAVAHGKSIARSLDQFLRGEPVRGINPHFDSRMGALQRGDIDEFMKEVYRGERVVPEGGDSAGFNDREAAEESARCMHCDCKKGDSCRLRDYARCYHADQQHFKFKRRNVFERILQHGRVVYEPGKCIKCGLCVQITKEAGEPYGVTFVSRGFDVRIAAPFQVELREAITVAARQCVEACPTAALSWKEELEESDSA